MTKKFNKCKNRSTAKKVTQQHSHHLLQAVWAGTQMLWVEIRVWEEIHLNKVAGNKIHMLNLEMAP